MTSNDAEKTSEMESKTQAMTPGEQTVLVDIPKVLGSYTLTRLLGRGGMGEVWQAFDKNLERDVAVKLMRKELLQNDDATRRFSREARAVARLNHPNIVHVYAFGDEKGLMYFVMELVEGNTLSQRLKQEGCVDLSDAVGIMMQAIDGLSYACERGIIHRDIKPSNLMITPDGRVKIADFGLAKMVEHDTQMTAAGSAMGSPSYMSPEQARGEEADHRSDIYALGVSLYQMLCGGLPFTGDSPLSVLLKQIQEPLPEPEHLKQLRNGAALDVIKRMTAKAPEDRYQNYEELATALTAVVPERRFVGVHSITSSYPAAGDSDMKSAGAAAVTGTLLAGKGGEPTPSASTALPASDFTSVSSDSEADGPRPVRKRVLGPAAAGVGLLAVVLVAVAIWWLGSGHEKEAAGAGPITAEAGTVTSPGDANADNAIPAAVTPAPAPSAAPAVTPIASPAAAQQTATVSATPAPTTAMQPVDITATVPVMVTPMPGVQTVLTPRAALTDLLPEGVEPLRRGTSGSDAGTPSPVYVLGTEGAAPDEQVPVYRDDLGRVILGRYPAGTRVQVLSSGASMLRVLMPGGEAVYVYRGMTHRQ